MVRPGLGIVPLVTHIDTCITRRYQRTSVLPTTENDRPVCRFMRQLADRTRTHAAGRDAGLSSARRQDLVCVCGPGFAATAAEVITGRRRGGSAGPGRRDQ